MKHKGRVMRPKFLRAQTRAARAAKGPRTEFQAAVLPKLEARQAAAARAVGSRAKRAEADLHPVKLKVLIKEQAAAEPKEIRKAPRAAINLQARRNQRPETAAAENLQVPAETPEMPERVADQAKARAMLHRDPRVKLLQRAVQVQELQQLKPQIRDHRKVLQARQARAEQVRRAAGISRAIKVLKNHRHHQLLPVKDLQPVPDQEPAAEAAQVQARVLPEI